MRQAFYLYEISWRKFEGVFSLYNDLRWTPDGQMSYVSQASLVLIHRPPRRGASGGLDWSEREIRTKNLESGARNTRRLLHLRYRAPFSVLSCFTYGVFTLAVNLSSVRTFRTFPECSSGVSDVLRWRDEWRRSFPGAPHLHMTSMLVLDDASTKSKTGETR